MSDFRRLWNLPETSNNFISMFHEHLRKRDASNRRNEES
jgi:hypothetical protein